MTLIIEVVAQGHEVTVDEAVAVAQNWSTLVIEQVGDWGGAQATSVVQIELVEREGEFLGYFCFMEPDGFVMIAPNKELAPVKAYSAESNIEPTSKTGIMDIITSGIAEELAGIQSQRMPLFTANPLDATEHFTEHYDLWVSLANDTYTFDAKLRRQVAEERCFGGRKLLSSYWHQKSPYNKYTPKICPERGNNATDVVWRNSPVGCVATAAAQIMRYWAWPPYGRGSVGDFDFSDTYDWKHMANQYKDDGDDDDSTWNDENDNLLSDSHVNSVAILCREIGAANGMEYNCDDSTAWVSNSWGSDMLDAFENHFRFDDDADEEFRLFESSDRWFDRIVSNINANRPLLYAISIDLPFSGHAIVCDGWQEIAGVKQYHMNYGWGQNNEPNDIYNNSYTKFTTCWYTLDELYRSQAVRLENMIVKLRPKNYIGTDVLGVYDKKQFPYRYFDQNAKGGPAVFQPGQNLQFLPGVVVTCTGNPDLPPLPTDVIEFRSGYLYSIKGTSSDGAEAYSRIQNAGTMLLHKGGSIRFH